jgi:hypothetical protein
MVVEAHSNLVTNANPIGPQQLRHLIAHGIQLRKCDDLTAASHYDCWLLRVLPCEISRMKPVNCPF